jgi:hypothetical protein
MTTESTVAIESTEVAPEASSRDSSPPRSGGKQPITPAERWALICKNVYTRAQKRGFVGGNPLQDLADAEQEIDDAYETDFKCVFSLTSRAEITEQLKSLFAGYGFDQQELEHLLDGHQEGLERLAAMNRGLLHGTSALVVKQTQVLKEVASEAVMTLRSFTHGRLRSEGVFNIAELSMQAFDNALMGSESSTDRVKETPSAALLQGLVASGYQDRSAKQLMDAPVTAIQGISTSLEKNLNEEFGISTIHEMATNKHAKRARAVVLLADAIAAEELSSGATGASSAAEAETCNALPAAADAPITEVRDIGQSQARLLQEGLGIETVRDLGTHPLFDVAWAIVMLADSEA